MGHVGHTRLAEVHGRRAPFAVAPIWCAVVAISVLTLYRPPHDLPSRIKSRIKGPLPRKWSLIALAAIA